MVKTLPIFNSLTDNLSVPRTTALHGKVPQDKNGISLKEHLWTSKWIIRSDFSDATVAKNISSACGVSVPKACAFKENADGDKRLSWVSPNELLLYCPARNSENIIEKLHSKLQKSHANLIEVSDYYTILNLKGEKAADIINTESPLDIRLKSFPVGSCAGTLFANATILLSRVGSQEFDIQIRWSFADYLWSHFLDAIEGL